MNPLHSIFYVILINHSPFPFFCFPYSSHFVEPWPYKTNLKPFIRTMSWTVLGNGSWTLLTMNRRRRRNAELGTRPLCFWFFKMCLLLFLCVVGHVWMLCVWEHLQAESFAVLCWSPGHLEFGRRIGHRFAIHVEARSSTAQKIVCQRGNRVPSSCSFLCRCSLAMPPFQPADDLYFLTAWRLGTPTIIRMDIATAIAATAITRATTTMAMRLEVPARGRGGVGSWVFRKLADSWTSSRIF